MPVSPASCILRSADDRGFVSSESFESRDFSALLTLDKSKNPAAGKSSMWAGLTRVKIGEETNSPTRYTPTQRSVFFPGSFLLPHSSAGFHLFRFRRNASRVRLDQPRTGSRDPEEQPLRTLP